MTQAPTHWPCPVCAAEAPAGARDCPNCAAPAEWIDRLLALDFAIRRFHLASLVGELDRPQYRQVVEDSRQRRDAMAQAAQARQTPPSEDGLPPLGRCWRCGLVGAVHAHACAGCGARLDAPAARLLRHLDFFRHEIDHHGAAGRIAPAQAERLRAAARASADDARARLGE